MHIGRKLFFRGPNLDYHEKLIRSLPKKGLNIMLNPIYLELLPDDRGVNDVH